ncbi:Por secretion system C-terminal sorting domain-containing protein [Segatella bryantii]|uniref:type IX secretion system sortase PorU n=1 Tax=Segatella bryantii TaxID=77095 RepID=UPI000894DA2F|nr:type IX secretion system sortase PorU [Segatella bryantii]SEA29124.1 Por secretion system C-terminal sorting domain-containing protein [Segatella bryantii]
MKAFRVILLFLVLCSLNVTAQKHKRFFNLTTENVKLDSVLQEFVHTIPLVGNYQDSVYTAELCYPEYMDMTSEDIASYQRLSGEVLPASPVIHTDLSVFRGRGRFTVSFLPIVYRNNKYQMLVSFMLTITSQKKNRIQKSILRVAQGNGSRYAEHSVLAQGTWAKIRVPESGVFQLTDAIIRKAGFSDLSKVKIYGYGGKLQYEALHGDTLRYYDDLQEVPTCTVGGKRLFYAQGPISWTSKTATRRTRNPYSDYGYYFITQSEDTPKTIDSVSFIQSFYPSPDYYHSHYEVDGYSWYPGGRNLFDNEEISSTKTLVMKNETNGTTGRLAACITAGTNSTARVILNGDSLNLSVSLTSYDKGNQAIGSFLVKNLGERDTIQIKVLSGGPIRLDYLTMVWDSILPRPNLLTDNFSAPTYVCNITNQDHHADSLADMVIVIPTSQKLLEQAKRLKLFHETHDSLSVNIVPADELYNEFSSGTPDAMAYRRYLKMLYDKANATNATKTLKYFLLFGDCVWDNRMLTSDCSSLNPDDYLLAFESENSFNEISCYVDDSWYGILQDGKGLNPSIEQIDVGVGRFPVVTADEAKVMVDKTINYITNNNAGAWQNSILFLGDDGNDNLHMRDENEVADYISQLYPSFLMNKVMWDAYTRESSSTGNTYPEVTSLIKQQMANGALLFDYAGHGSESQLSHEAVLKITDFEEFTNTRLPLWITASCDIMPFDGVKETIGEASVLNANGGTMAFYGTTRTVYADLNKKLNRAFLKYVLGRDENGKPYTLGEAHVLAQNDMINGTGYNGESDRTTNHLQYSLLGDPALALNLPSLSVTVDDIDGVSISDSVPTLKAGSKVTVKGHVENASNFNGVLSVSILDSKDTITCKVNDISETSEPFVFTSYDKVLYSGNDSVRNGQFEFSFAVPKDIKYSSDSGLMNFYVVNTDHTLTGNGYTVQFKLGGSNVSLSDSIGPKIFSYLNYETFMDGGNVNATPYFYAELSDTSGINATGNGIGHDLELIIDGDASKTYNLNSYFSPKFGTYQEGTVGYLIPELAEGKHSLLFRAWDTLNNSSTFTLNFNVVNGLTPTLRDIYTSVNPASTTTDFIVVHDRINSSVNVEIEVFDTSGRIVWSHSGSGASEDHTYRTTWDLSSSAGGKLSTGVYIYRAKISSEGSSTATKAKKLIIVNNN